MKVFLYESFLLEIVPCTLIFYIKKKENVIQEISLNDRLVIFANNALLKTSY